MTRSSVQRKSSSNKQQLPDNTRPKAPLPCGRSSAPSAAATVQTAARKTGESSIRMPETRTNRRKLSRKFTRWVTAKLKK